MTAVFSPCGRYRLRLDRQIDMLGDATVGFCLHNPSTAGVDAEDPTSRRGIGFATRWGASRLIYVNPWAGIATKPAVLWDMPEPVGPDCDKHIRAAAEECRASGGFMVAAWGCVSPPARLRQVVAERLFHVEALIRATGCQLRALGVNADGSPKHPLYVRADTVPTPWLAPWRQAA